MAVCKLCCRDLDSDRPSCSNQQCREKISLNIRRLIRLFIITTFILLVILAIGKAYQISDRDPQRGAIPINRGAMGENYATPKYLSQGWSNSESLWFYNTTQGSDLMPYDFFMALEKLNGNCSSAEALLASEPIDSCLFRSNTTIDQFRYLPQRATRFNPDGLPVGFVKDSYDGIDYIGYTCAACHTGQVNYRQQALRIDGGPAMADMVGFLQALEHALRATLNNDAKRERFVKNVLHRNSSDQWINSPIHGGGNYDSRDQVINDLEVWTNRISAYSSINASSTEYGYARLDAFGRIYNRVLEHVINKSQAATRMASVTTADTTQSLLSRAEIDKVLAGLNEVILGEAGFEKIIARLKSREPGYPGLNEQQLQRVWDAIFNEANAPVSYPFLWDIAQADYVQWNGLAANAGIGPLGRNTGEVIGVFGKLDRQEDKPSIFNLFHINLAAKISGQESKRHYINFKSSIDKVNLRRLESHLKDLTSPKWPDGCNNSPLDTDRYNCYATTKGQRNVTLAPDERPIDMMPDIDLAMADQGRFIYARYCESCHELIDHNNFDRKIIGKMLSLETINTDPQMAENSVTYTGSSGNFKHIYQTTDAGPVIVEDEAPVVQILTAASRGVIATRDYDKHFFRRWADWLYTLGASFFDNNIKQSVKAGDYNPDTTAQPYASLKAYKARSLNGIWAAAPYLHNGSVPTIYDLLLPHQRSDDPLVDLQGNAIEYRPAIFTTGAREFDPVKVGFISADYSGFRYDTTVNGNTNTGHEYAAGRTMHPGMTEPLPALDKTQRMQLLEFIKTL